MFNNGCQLNKMNGKVIMLRVFSSVKVKGLKRNAGVFYVYVCTVYVYLFEPRETSLPSALVSVP